MAETTDKNLSNKNSESSSLIKDEEVLKIITKASAKASGIAALPVPLLDIAGVSFVQLKMVEQIGERYGLEVTDKSNILISSIVTSLLGKLISLAISQAVNATSLDKILGESLVKASIAGFVTTITGEVYHDHFSKKGTFEDISVDHYLDYFKDQINSDRLTIDKLGSQAISSILGK